jgi:uroporphyrinogen III methyltransferase/synthase
MSVLAGKRIVVTRAPAQAAGLRTVLEGEGAEVVLCPTIQVTAPEDYGPMDAALSQLSNHAWLVFTSANGVRFTLDRMSEIGIDYARRCWLRVAAVGAETQRALAERGVPVTFVGAGGGAAGLARSLPSVEGTTVLLARSDIADPVPADILRSRGAMRADDIIAYRTVPVPPPANAIEELERGVDAVTFTSPSTVRGFVALGPRWRRLLGDARIVTIGPTTSAAAKDVGLEVHAEAEEPDARALVEALIAALRRP